MSVVFKFLVIFVLIHNFGVLALTSGGNHVCKNERYVKEKYHVKCSFWKWGRCTRYRTVDRSTYSCCTGWKQYPSTSDECNYAICDGKINPDDACNQFYTYDYIRYRSGSIQRSSGGTCKSPNTCENCNDGFYSTGPTCDICPKIDYCNHRACSSPSDNVCKYCYGEVKPKSFWRAYTPAIDGGKTCREACSWRSSSTRCYPGRCSQELAANCQCVKGFTGHHCQTMTESPEILYNEAKLEDGKNVLVNPTDPNVASNSQPTVWTNNIRFYYANVEFKGKYVITEIPPAPDPTGESHYVTAWASGIISGSIRMNLLRGTTQKTITYNCPGASQASPKPTNYVCKTTMWFSSAGWPVPFQHNDRVEFIVQVSNGGYVEVINRELFNRRTKFWLQGKTTTIKYIYHWDTTPPYHCVGTNAGGCSQPISTPDITDNPVIVLSWRDWKDDLSQLGYYQYELYDLGHDGSLLSQDKGALVKGPIDIDVTKSQETLTLSKPGMYGLVFSAFDKAGNYKTSRALFLFDDQSVVDKDPDKKVQVTNASPDTGKKWIVYDTTSVHINWENRFLNKRHLNNLWLKEVEASAHIETAYDDKYGRRTTAEINNVRACVDFQVAFKLYGTPSSVKQEMSFTSISNIHDQSKTLNNVNWNDGDQLVVTVKAFDVLGKSANDSVTVYRDASYPVIQNLWLTRGNQLNISVHSVEDFTKLTIEWEAYDYHSGIDTISWRLFDNYTGVSILHGLEHLPAQGLASNLSGCENRYGSYPRGHKCYCTQFHGCFHRHFQVKPRIVDGAGLLVGKDNGKHDYDYFIEVNVTNIAQLKTQKIIKITIDTTPPATGSVNDGIKGQPEIDFQQSKTLHAHWEGFFDRESGVKYYQYGFHNRCLDASDFNLDDAGKGVFEETYSTHASTTVTTEGKYYITVVAYNRAYEPSAPVCSDGVVVDTLLPTIKEVVIEGAKIQGGLVTDGSDVWVVGNDRYRRFVANPPAYCRTKATVLSDLALIPVQHDANGIVISVNATDFCSNTSSAPNSLTPVLSQSSRLMIHWLVENSPSGVHDFKVGLSSTVSTSAPDILPLTSTKQHAHYIFHHLIIPDGSLFYIVIETISKSNIISRQHIGPCVLDSTAPDVAPNSAIDVNLVDDFLVANWPSNMFVDTEEPYSLFYTFAIGHFPHSNDVMDFKPLGNGTNCFVSNQPTCSAVRVGELNWFLHGHHTYYVTVRVINTAGLVSVKTSSPYIHDVQMPSKGVVLDINPQNSGEDIPLLDIEDIDFTTETSKMAIRWSGFEHPHLNVTYRISIGSSVGASDILQMTDLGTSNSYTQTGLNLQLLQTYFATVTALTDIGSVNVSSDGLTIVQENMTLTGITIHDGINCTSEEYNETMFTHHDAERRMVCEEDINYQMSITTLQAYWSVPSDMKLYTPDIFYGIEERATVGNFWTMFKGYEYIHTTNTVTSNGLNLKPGRAYRFVVKFCASEICFEPLRSDGVLVLSYPPATGNLVITHQNVSTVTGYIDTLKVVLDRFYDPDIQDTTLKFDVVDKYEWTITDNSQDGHIHTQWKSIETFNVLNGQMNFDISLNGTLDFSRCRKLSVRGYNRVLMSSVISKEIKECAAFDPLIIVPNLVIDAVGLPDINSDGTVSEDLGKPIYMRPNSKWEYVDKDYTPYKNVLSAVWPTLRHSRFNWAALDSSNVLDASTYYLPESSLSLADPCSHPESVKCGTTQNQYVNLKFSESEYLHHGHRYIICIHAVETSIQHERWTEILPEINTCSDGVVVDLTSPQAKRVWIGHSPGIEYQSSTSNLYINWESFLDIEEFGTNPHATGVKEYLIGVGSSPNGHDIVASKNVGVTNHIAIHNLHLNNGHKYFASITARDFANRTTTKVSEPIIIDETPPIKTKEPITINGRHITSLTEIEACWKNLFYDSESGIEKFMWSIGSRPGYSDIMSSLKSELECGVSSSENALKMTDGHAYFINVEAFNGAGLSSLATSWAFVVDTTPPVAGHVYDGNNSNSNEIKDVDYQTDTSSLYAFWEGFHDQHSAIKDFFVCVGDCPHCDNVLSCQSIGITTEFVLRNIQLSTGLKYYVTVTACNTADLCTSVMSDGVILDNSPPSPGIVFDGTDVADIEYQSIRTIVGAKWYGFEDPESGIDHYEWRIGTTPKGDNVLANSRLHLAEMATIGTPTIQQLPINQRIYVTIRAVNKAGLMTESVSNGFIIDNTAPVITSPMLNKKGSLRSDTIVYRTSFGVSWTATDKESYIERQYLSIESHLGGEFNLSSIQINGIVREYFFTGLQLHDGSCYFVTLIVCNGAKLCSNATSESICMDSTPPTRGMFAIKTDHAANLKRHDGVTMFWMTNEVRIAWLGFFDIHSGIDYYLVSVGSSYMNNDLNQVRGDSEQFSHVNNSIDLDDEGYVQVVTVKTTNLDQLDDIYVSVWAVNKVGLRSAIIHSKFKLIPGGFLDLERRCTAYSCVGHCICAAQDKICSLSSTIGPCLDLTNNNPNNILSVADLITLGSGLIDIDYIPSDTNLFASWSIIHAKGKQPLWYEWSVGITSHTNPEGVFDPITDRVWHDAGQNMDVVFTTKQGTKLKEGMRYSVFIRAWYSPNQYALFKSDGVVISTKAPATTNMRGSSVVEKTIWSKLKDEDYIKHASPIRIEWTNKFLDALNSINEFKVYLSTNPGGHDVYTTDDLLSGSVSHYDVVRHRLVPGRKYFTNVVGYGHSGLHTTSSSDGFILDNTLPDIGHVYDGIGVNDLEYQNSTDVCSASWRGFKDTISSLSSYYWRVITIDTDEVVCPWKNYGLHTSASRAVTQSSIDLQGRKVYSQVYVVDSAGQKSNIATSDGVTLDLTPPVPLYLIHTDENVLQNPSFENIGGTPMDWNNIDTTDICKTNMYKPDMWNLDTYSCAVTISSSSILAKHGRNFLFFRGIISQTLSVQKNEHYRVTFVSSHLPINNSVLASKEGIVQFGQAHHVFLLYVKGYRKDGHGSAPDREVISWHNHTFYFQALESEVNFSLSTIDDKTGMFIDDIRIQMIEVDNKTSQSGHAIAHAVFLHQWASIHGSWKFVDSESPIIDYSWAIGYRKGGTQIQGFKSTGLKTYGYNKNITLVHNSYIFITVIATNAAGLIGVSYSDPILIDLTPPVITDVIDGLVWDEDARQLNEISTKWSATDPESSIEFCEWAIGFQPNGNEIQVFTLVPNGKRQMSRNVDYYIVAARRVFVTIRCQNKAGLQAIASSNGVIISKEAASTSLAYITPIPLSVSEYSPRNNYQSVTNKVCLKWTGFKGAIGIEKYKINVQDGSSSSVYLDETLYAADQDYMYLFVKDLSMAEGPIDISVQAINSLYIESDMVTSNITTSYTQPAVLNSNLQVSFDSSKKHLTVSWNNVFAGVSVDKFYEVSAGTVPGGADIIQWQETKYTSISFELPEKVLNQSNLSIYLHVRCFTSSGIYVYVNKHVTIATI